MRLIILDTEYLSLTKKYSSYHNLIKYKKKLFPEIIQIGAYQFNTSKFKPKPTRLNIFFKIKQVLPKRIEVLTGIKKNFLKSRGNTFENNLSILLKFIKNKDIILVNGDDAKLIKFNCKYYKIKKFNRKIYYVNLKKLTDNVNTDVYYKKYKSKKKKHNAINDCMVLSKFVKDIIDTYGILSFKTIINNSKTSVQF